jgi:hypothetical protein
MTKIHVIQLLQMLASKWIVQQYIFIFFRISSKKLLKHLRPPPPLLRLPPPDSHTLPIPLRSSLASARAGAVDRAAKNGGVAGRLPVPHLAGGHDGPVILPSGHTFERRSIQRWLDGGAPHLPRHQPPAVAVPASHPQPRAPPPYSRGRCPGGRWWRPGGEGDGVSVVCRGAAPAGQVGRRRAEGGAGVRQHGGAPAAGGGRGRGGGEGAPAPQPRGATTCASGSSRTAPSTRSAPPPPRR